MALNEKYYEAAHAALEARRAANRAEENFRRMTVAKKIPEYAQLEKSLAANSAQLVPIILAQGADTHERLEALKTENLMIQRSMAELLKAAGVNASWIRRDLSDGITGRADLVTCAYCLNEMAPSRRSAVVEQLARAADKLLVIIEPGTPAGFAELREIRRQLIGMGMKIAAPCPGIADCPLAGDDWCHFTARIQRSKLHKRLKGGEVPYEDEKFCFIAAVKGECAPCGARVLRHPQIESGKITLRLCTCSGTDDRVYTSKSRLFKPARKSDSGDSFPEE